MEATKRILVFGLLIDLIHFGVLPAHMKPFLFNAGGREIQTENPLIAPACCMLVSKSKNSSEASGVAGEFHVAFTGYRSITRCSFPSHCALPVNDSG